MISKTIKYVDYNGLEKEETFWFNMSRTDLMRMEASEEGGWEQRLRKTVALTRTSATIKSSVRRLPMTISSGISLNIQMKLELLLTE